MSSNLKPSTFYVTSSLIQSRVSAFDTYEEAKTFYDAISSDMGAVYILASFVQYGNNIPVIVGLLSNANPFLQEYQDLKDKIRNLEPKEDKTMHIMEAFKSSSDIVDTALSWKGAAKLNFRVLMRHAGKEWSSVMRETEATALLEKYSH
jgi:hypothetical protein